MGDACECFDFCGDDPCASVEVKRKARTTHRCEGCETAIIEGDEYVRVTCFSDGRAETFKYHSACRDLLGDAAAVFADGSFFFGCSFVGCIDGWASALNPKDDKWDAGLVVLIDRVYALMARGEG